MLTGAVLADSKPMSAILVSGWIAIAHHGLYSLLAYPHLRENARANRKQTVYSSLLMLAGAILADPEPMSASLVSGCLHRHGLHC